jgi:hypothetical protein
MLYFNYFLDTENANWSKNQQPAPPGSRMNDAFRVFIADDSGDWQLLGTNNSAIGPNLADDELNDIGPFDVQELAGKTCVCGLISAPLAR